MTSDAATTPQARRTERHAALDLLRGCAALGIAVYHWVLIHLEIDILSLGRFGVYLFFVLSALTMTMVYASSFKDGISPAAAKSFYLNRVARLLPLLALVCAAQFALTVLTTPDQITTSAARLFFTASGLFALGPPAFLSGANNSWSLGIEIAFYAVTPLAVMVAARARRRSIVIALVAALIAQIAYIDLVAGTQAIEAWHYYTMPLSFAAFFVAGMLIYRLPAHRSPLMLIPAAMCFAPIASFSLFSAADLTAASLTYLGLSLAAMSSVYFASRSAVPPMLRPLAEFLGNISYALYLTHPFTNMLVGRVDLIRWQQFTLYIVASMAVAYGTYRFFEQPMRDMLRGVGSRPAVATLP